MWWSDVQYEAMRQTRASSKACPGHGCSNRPSRLQTATRQLKLQLVRSHPDLDSHPDPRPLPGPDLVSAGAPPAKEPKQEARLQPLCAGDLEGTRPPSAFHPLSIFHPLSTLHRPSINPLSALHQPDTNLSSTSPAPPPSHEPALQVRYFTDEPCEATQRFESRRVRKPKPRKPWRLEESIWKPRAEW